MNRVLTLALLLIMPMLELQAQRSNDREDSDSTESTVVRGIAVFGGIGFSLLRLALYNYDNGAPAQRSCFLACNGSRRMAALSLSSGPTSWKANNNWEPLGERIANAVNEARNENANRADPDNVLLNSNDTPGLGDNEEFSLPSQSAKKGLPWSDDTPPNDFVPQFDQGCMLHTCSSDLKLLNSPPPQSTPNGWHNTSYTPTTTVAELNLLLDQEQIGTIVNPEPSTWALMAAGMLGLVAAGRRKR